VIPYEVERDTVNGHSFYLYVNKQKGVIYVGRNQAYQRYDQLLRQQAAAENAAEAAYANYLKHIDQNHSLNYE